MTKEEELYEAAKYGNLQKVKNLVSQGINIHVENEKAFRWAAANGHLDIVKYLVKCGVDVYVYNEGALYWARHNSHQDIVEYLKNYRKIQPNLKEVFNLKELNTDGRKFCAKCSGELKIVSGFLGSNFNYCPICE